MRGKRHPLQREQDLERTVQLRMMGHTHTQIADILYEETGTQLSKQQIAKDLKAVRESWLKTRVSDYDVLVQQELVRLDVLENELWKALRMSMEKHTEKIIVKTLRDDELEDEAKIRKITEIIKDGTPAAALFGQIQSCQKERRRLLGLYHDERQSTTHVVVKGFTVVSPDIWPTHPPEIIDGQTVEPPLLPKGE